MSEFIVSEAYTPEIDKEEFPPMLQMKSVHNTPMWHWFAQTFGQNIKDTIRGGFEQGIYNPNNTIHPYVIHTFTNCCIKILTNLLDYYFTGYGQRSSKFNSTNLLNIGITTKSVLSQYVGLNAKACVYSSSFTCSTMWNSC